MRLSDGCSATHGTGTGGIRGGHVTCPHEVGCASTQRLKLGKRNAGKQVTVIVEDTPFRILYEGEELAVKQWRNPGPIKGVKVISRREHSQATSSIY